MEFHASIVGLPRSRTFWFSQLLTFAPYYCFHDWHSYRKATPANRILLNSSCSPWNKQTGKLVIIERDVNEALESFKRYADPSVVFDEGMLLDQFAIGQECLDALEGMRVKFHQVDKCLPQILTYINVNLPQSYVRHMARHVLNSPDNGEALHADEYKWSDDDGERSLNM